MCFGARIFLQKLSTYISHSVT